jgi:glucoamylase
MKNINCEKINKLIEISKNVISDCVLDNGGIIAANSTKRYFHPTAKNYFYVWPRDASYTCIALDILGIKNTQEAFFNWCLNNAEGFKQNGLFYEKYYPNGLKALQNFQPDQTGMFMYALNHHGKYFPKSAPIIKKLITLAANGLCNAWEETHFNKISNDIWEERLCFPDLDENFSYSLAACIAGLRCANEVIPEQKWLGVSKEMEKQLEKHFNKFFIRSFGKIPDSHIDASIIGLTYPFGIFEAKDARMVSSVKEMEKRIIINGGLHRYENDEYDGWMFDGLHRKKGAGAWPVLNFWLAIYYSLKGDDKTAEKYYFWVLDRLNDDGFMPEQIFENSTQVSVSPLVWSHSMFILASKQLGFI